MKSFGAIAYEAYCEHTKLASGHELQQWCNLAQDVQSAWEAAAGAVLCNITETSEARNPRGGDR